MLRHNDEMIKTSRATNKASGCESHER